MKRLGTIVASTDGALDRSLQNPARLAALADTDLPDSAAEESFDRLTRMVTRLLGVPVALVSLVDDARQFFKSQQGLQAPFSRERQTPLSHSFCQYVVIDRAPLIVKTILASATTSRSRISVCGLISAFR